MGGCSKRWHNDGREGGVQIGPKKDDLNNLQPLIELHCCTSENLAPLWWWWKLIKSPTNERMEMYDLYVQWSISRWLCVNQVDLFVQIDLWQNSCNSQNIISYNATCPRSAHIVFNGGKDRVTSIGVEAQVMFQIESKKRAKMERKVNIENCLQEGKLK